MRALPPLLLLALACVSCGGAAAAFDPCGLNSSCGVCVGNPECVWCSHADARSAHVHWDDAETSSKQTRALSSSPPPPPQSLGL